MKNIVGIRFRKLGKIYFFDPQYLVVKKDELVILENEDGEVLLDKSNLKEVMLGHLSKENNFPELAYQTVIEELHKNNIDTDSLKLSVANRYNPSKIIKVS